MHEYLEIIQTIIFALALLVYIKSQQEDKEYRKVQNINEFTKRYSQIVYNFPEKIIIEDIPITALSREEKYALIKDMRSYFDLCFDEYMMYKRKYVNDEIWNVWKGGISRAMERKPFQDSWVILQKDTAFGDEFDSFINKLVEKSKVS